MLKASTPTEESVVKPSAKARPRSATRGPPRLDPTQREAIITREAVAFFAECGFEGQTRELAKRLRITQPFPWLISLAFWKLSRFVPRARPLGGGQAGQKQAVDA